MTPVSVIVAPFPVSAPGPVACEPGVPGTPAQRVEGARGCQSDGLLPRPLLLTSADLQRPHVLTSSEAGLTLAPEATSARAEEAKAEQATPHLNISLTWNTDTRSRRLI